MNMTMGRGDARTGEVGGDRPAGSKPRFGLARKIILFVAAVLLPLGAVTWAVSVWAIRESMTDEFTSKGTAIATSLATSGVDLILNRDASTVQDLVDKFAAINGVAYVMVYDAGKTLIAHTFHPVVPSGIVEKNLVPGGLATQVREVVYPDPVTGVGTAIIAIGVPMLGGQLGTVRVGMNKAVIMAAATRSGNYLLLVFAGAAVLAALAGVVFARRITQPVARLVAVARRVGQGDLTELVPVTSRDEIGQLAETFNQTIVRLRSQVQTEAERDQERRSREELQKNITHFLHTVEEISAGDLTRRGEVTADVLGNVVDAINVMVAEIGTVMLGVRHAALRAASSANQMIGATGHMTVGAQAEVRKLAERCAKATRDIAALIKKVQGETQDAIAVVERGTQEVETGYRVTVQAGKSLAEIATVSQKSAALAQDISLATHRQVRGADDVA